MERSRHWERREAAPDLRCKGRDGDGVGALRGCSGALLPSSFGRVADLRTSNRTFHPGWMKAGQGFYFLSSFCSVVTPTSRPDFYDFELSGTLTFMGEVDLPGDREKMWIR